ncbi:MAG: hypothetical protein KJ798_14175 [Gammaproteobacteria bacterium]|nr:hypothetical protein [Gammaproteobacteria bacterium]MBU0849182.1 hypothetical protein [Gammaproteobacteria bacterium]MBU1267933.1 hypothetical protein [Gammaproteobacteria bacterium]MBU1528312.1 hypothetical protein [Gammaproteobacteria bacterium]MBU1781519.1 hypothetical protein [Gammaproteobacteria bacterium]
MANPVKEFHQYLTNATNSHVSHAEYLVSPAVAFLKYTVEAKSSIDLCARYFPKKVNGQFTKDSLDSLQHLISASLPTIMGHFETYQRYLFAGIFDLSVYLANFDTNKFFENLSKETNINIDWPRLAAHRGIGAHSIGTLLSDSMSGWHDPERVNRYFGAYKLPFTPYGLDAIEKLKTLWQLRHSIAHTGGTLSLADAQKVKSLNNYGGKQIAFEKQFTFEVARKLHPIVKSATVGLGTAFTTKVIPGLGTHETARINKFFEVKSSIPSWLK